MRGAFKAFCTNGRTLATRRSARANFARCESTQPEYSLIAFILAHRASEHRTPNDRKHRNTGNSTEVGCCCRHARDPQQAQATPRQLRIPNFAILYSRAAVIRRGMTNCWNEAPRTLGSWLGKLRVTGFAAFGNLRGLWKSVQNDQRLAAVRAGILCRLTIAAQRTQLIYQRTAPLIGRWSSWTATTTQLLAERISAKLIMVSRSQDLRRLRHACGENLRVLTALAPVVWAVIIVKKFLAYRAVVPTRRVSRREHLDQK